MRAPDLQSGRLSPKACPPADRNTETELVLHLPRANVIYGSICLPPVGSDLGGQIRAPSVKVEIGLAWGAPGASPGRDPTSGLALAIPDTKCLERNLTGPHYLILCSAGKNFVT